MTQQPHIGNQGGFMLTTRELDVLALLARGCSYAAIGERLGISAHTVASHIKNAYRKLEVHSGPAAVMRAVELRILGEGALPDGEILPDRA